MSDSHEQTEPIEQIEQRGLVGRSMLIGLGLFVLLLGAIALIVWIKGSSEPLPFEYEGF